jgi:3-oxoacyl-[acyl-carrier protein] reductase
MSAAQPPLERVALLAGGAGQLGQVVLGALQRAGHCVIVLDRDITALRHRADVEAHACDLTDEAATRAAFAQAWERAGQIPVLVNCAGLIHNAPLIRIGASGERRHSVADWRHVMDANLTTAFLAAVTQAERMVATRTRGVIVTLSSIAAAGNAGQGAYAAAKAGVNAATQAWAKELGPLGIRFVAIAPGFIDTPSTQDAMHDAVLRDWAKRTPLRRLGRAEDIAAAVLFAINNPFLSGKLLEIDGGLTL